MPDNFKIKPTKPTTEALVIDPITFIPLKTAGEVKPKTMYWLAKINDGDAEVVPQTTADKTEKAATEKDTAATEKDTAAAEKAEKDIAAKAKKDAADKKAAAKKTTKK